MYTLTQEDHMSKTYLASVMGAYLVIFGLLMLIQYTHIQAVLKEVVAKKSLVFISGIISAILGLLMVFSHNVWTHNWQVVVTVMAWLVLLTGLLRLFFPAVAIKWMRVLYILFKIYP
jgi:uncharacterized membrane protein HdeD (DUF308 family)